MKNLGELYHQVTSVVTASLDSAIAMLLMEISYPVQYQEYFWVTKELLTFGTVDWYQRGGEYMIARTSNVFGLDHKSATGA